MIFGDAELPPKFWASCAVDALGCWRWSGPSNQDGYARFNTRGRRVSAARIAYVAAHGPVPEGSRLRASCRNPSCVNPEHHASMTVREICGLAANYQSKKTTCPRGHQYDKVRPDGSRSCRACDNAASAEAGRRIRADAFAQMPPKTGFVYFLQCRELGAVKVGVARNNFMARIKALRVGCPLPLEILGIYRSSDYRHDERAIHRRFAEDRIRGEWYRASSELMSIVSDMPSMLIVQRGRRV